MKMNIIVFLFTLGALALAACGALRSQVEPAVEIGESPAPAETPIFSTVEGTPPETSDPDQPVSSDSGSTPAPPAYLPQPGDEKLYRSQVYIDSADLLTLESYPVQYRLHLKGNLPDPCHQLRVEIRPPDARQRVVVDAYSVADPSALCAQVLVPFEETISLDGLPAGTYTVLLNEQNLGEIVIGR